MAIGAAAGEGRLLLATVATAVTLLILERRYLPVLRVLDGGRWASRLGHEDLVPPSTGQDPEHTAPGREDDG